LFRFIPGVFFLTSLSLFIIAAARPQRMKEVIEQWSQGIDIVLAIDISESMLLRDFQPNRLESAKRVAQQFIKGRVHDRIGIVVFSGVAYPLAPLSTDYDFLCTLLQNVQPGSIDQSGTAIGSALAVACNRLKDIESNSKVIVLLSDGENTAGSIDPMVAAQIAATLNIKVYTIAIGKDGKVPFSEDSTGVIEYVDNVLNEAVLRKISSIGKGTFYRAYDQNLLYQIFENINKLEKSKISENRFRNFEDLYPIYIYWGLVFFLVWLLTKSTFLSNAMED
jgi:Ca-activated chloride channel family protein